MAGDRQAGPGLVRLELFPAYLTGALAAAIRGKGAEDLVFPDRNGWHLVMPTVTDRSWFDQALERAELPSMTIHDLRHTAASLAAASGAHVKAVQKMLGHGSAAMTLDVYADLFDDDLDGSRPASMRPQLLQVGRMWADGPPTDPKARPEGKKKPGSRGQ